MLALIANGFRELIEGHCFTQYGFRADMTVGNERNGFLQLGGGGACAQNLELLQGDEGGGQLGIARRPAGQRSDR